MTLGELGAVSIYHPFTLHETISFPP